MWGNRNVWILLSGEFVAGLGLWLGIIGNLDFLEKHVPSDFTKSLILFCGLFVGVLVGPTAGRIIDSTDKKKILIYSSFLRILSIGFMFMAIWQENVLFMVCNMMLVGISAAFYFPALQATIPLIVKEHMLLQVNGWHMNVATIARVAGTALAGILLLHMSLFSLYFYSMVAYILIFIVTFFYTIEEHELRERRKEKASFKDVFALLKEVPILLIGLILVLVPTLFIGSFNLMVMKISQIQGDPSVKGVLYTIEGTSFMLGAFLVKRLHVERRMVPFLIGCTLLIAVAQLSLYFATIPVASMVSFSLFGLGAGAFFPAIATLFQKQVKKEYHGRFFSFRSMFDRISFQLVLLGTGFFLDVIGFQWMVVCFGLFSLMIVMVVIIKQVKQPVEYYEIEEKEMSI
ncbi:MFS transporter [Bacillus sp. 165]|uniref:MFS transporter n=1 Tax=Bacillus sp. 165 TaxID=1529117 RepID=UPI001ADC64B2|nr:MFS transporter [Bacillus sp. 165]MBO9128434.1 MFS transporter [Bacillus sp. 165]